MTAIKSFAAAGCVVALMTGCATQVVDTTPVNPTSVLTANYAVNGVYVPDYHGVQTAYTREDKRRINHDTEFDSFMMRWANFKSGGIFRMDRNLLWDIDDNKETYRECPLAGCSDDLFELLDQSLQGNGGKSEDNDETYESYEDRGCQVKLVSNDFAVVPTGKTRVIAGLDANEYTVTWKTEFKDDQGKKDSNVVQFVFWTTTPTADMQEAWAIHHKATERYLDAVGDKNVLVRLLGKDGYRTLSAFTGDTEKTDKVQYDAFTRELAKVKGYPLSIKLEWFQKNEACAAAKNTSGAGAGGMDFSNGIEGAAKDLVGGFLSQQKDKLFADWEKEARVRYIYEVTSVSVNPIHDSQFEVPAGYKLMDRQ